MVILGANWCADAQCLEAIMQLPSVAQFIAEYYEVIRVDLGEYDINMDLIKYLGMPSQEGIPRVFILDLQGEPINLETNDQWRSARQSYPQDIFDYFQSFIKKGPQHRCESLRYICFIALGKIVDKLAFNLLQKVFTVHIQTQHNRCRHIN